MLWVKLLFVTLVALFAAVVVFAPILEASWRLTR
jgi:hypothetical protein